MTTPPPVAPDPDPESALDLFYQRPILNSPYVSTDRHWELDKDNRLTNRIVESRRPSSYVSPIPPARKSSGEQLAFVADDVAKAVETSDQQYDLTGFINGIRRAVDRWRTEPDERAWHVTPVTARLLRHWRHHRFADIRPFFCQLEAVETLIWLTEVAPTARKEDRGYLEHLANANSHTAADLESVLNRVALKLATGAGKTTVMALLIAWQTVNAVRHRGSRRFTSGFLVVTPGVTIRQRLRVLQPNDPDSYYASRELVPGDMLRDLERARIVITNYHAFMRRETLALSAGGRALLQGQGAPLHTRETDGQMLQRVMPELMGMKRILVLNDEAHHCYREKPDASAEGALKGDAKREAKKNNEKALVWISGIEAVQRRLAVQRVVDLSATPFFLSGSGYAEPDYRQAAQLLGCLSHGDAVGTSLHRSVREQPRRGLPSTDPCRFRRGCTRMSRTSPSSSTARHTYCWRPWIVTNTSSRCQRSPSRPRRRRNRPAYSGPRTADTTSGWPHR